jgi:hypothetical protein
VAGQVIPIIDKMDEGKTTGYEIMYITAVANGTGVSWTVTRGVESTTPYAHLANFTVVPVVTAVLLNTPTAVSVVTTSFTSNAYTLASGDANTAQQASNGSTAATITVPTNASVAFPVGTVVTITQTGTGKIQIAAAGGVTVDWSGTFSSGSTGCRAEYSSIGLLKTATNTWILSGDAA